MTDEYDSDPRFLKQRSQGEKRRMRSAALQSFDQLLLARTRLAVKVDTLSLLTDFPYDSLEQIAFRVGGGASAIGLLMAIYSEAENLGRVRGVALDLLLREILHKYPDGWVSSGSVRPIVKLGSWCYHIANYTTDSHFADSAWKIITSLTVDHPPTEGWRPQSSHDTLLMALFNRYWPL